MASQADELAAVRLRAEFPRALRSGQIVGHFQPEIELSTGRLVAAELLARWEHPELGTLAPASFLPLAEELGLMHELTLTMLRQGLGQHRAWAADGWAVRVSVNIGPGCVSDPDFPVAVARLLREQRVPGEMLVLEVSEETGTADASSWFFTELADFGVQVSLDDFGTGFASLESLGGWPINELKLDRSLVRPIIGSTTFRTIVRTTIDLAHQLGVKVVAEGVESAALSSELRALGCDIGQGFFLGRPMPAAEFTEWMRDPVRAVLRLAAASSPAAAARPARTGVDEAPCRAQRQLRRIAQPVGARELAAVTAMMVAYGLWQVFRWGGRAHQAEIGDLAFIPVNGTAILLAWRVARRADLGKYSARCWHLLTAALSLYLLGDLLQFVYENVLHERAYPTWADACYLSFYVIAAYALLSTRGLRQSVSVRLRRLLDLGTAFIGGVVLIWTVALGPAVAWAAGNERGFDLVNLVTYAYPVGDMLLLFGILSALWRNVAVPQAVLSLRLFALGVLLFIAADLTYDWLTVHTTYLGGDPVDTLWMLALSCVSLAASARLRSPAGGTIPARVPTPTTAAAARPSFAPYLATVSCFLLLAAVGLPTVPFEPLGGIILAAVLLTLLVTTRQYLALRDYTGLATQYQELAAVDGMTGLFNRRHFMERAEAAFAHAQRTGQPFAVLMIDVNKFKEINDTYGHIAGDQVLAELAQVCQEHTRPDDIVGRYGGDEFIIMVPGITSLRAIQLADQVVRPPSRVLGRDGKPLAYTVSVGIAESPPDHDLSVLLTHADSAMYEAKQAGGGWRIYGDTPAARQAELPRGQSVPGAF
jgi:diguanylate cyclase (GGDEF)-like protein